MKFLSLKQKEFYIENGYVKLGNILSVDESDRISDEYSDLFLVSFITRFIFARQQITKVRKKMPKLHTNES